MNLGTGDRIIRLIGGLGFVMIDYFSNAQWEMILLFIGLWSCLLYTSPSPRDRQKSRMPSSA